MKKETAKKKIQKHLWAWGYKVRDMQEILPGENSNIDLVVRVDKDSEKVYKVKVLTGEEDLNVELSHLDGAEHNVIALPGKKNKYAGGSQKTALFTTKHKEVFQ